MGGKCAIGLDFGTNSVRALVVDVATGRELGTSVRNYKRGEAGVVLDPRDPNLARQHPADYVEGTEASVRAALAQAKGRDGFAPEDVIGIGVDTTGSTPLPVDAAGEPLAFDPRFENHPAALAWLWKDHTAHAEAARVTQVAAGIRPEFLAKCGGTYSSEWFWAKILHARAEAPEVFDAAYTWVEIADWIPAFLTGTKAPDAVRRCICAAGHKAMFHSSWGGYPDAEFLAAVDEGLVRVRRTLPDRAFNIADAAGSLSAEWAERLGLRPGIQVAVGAFDVHLGAVGAGIEPGVMVKILGTSTCDIIVSPLAQELPDIPGVCGIVPESVLPGSYAIEAGQSAVGDIFNWFVNYMKPGGEAAGTHQALSEAAARLAPGESGLLALDWHNGNRTVLVDQRLTGALVGMTLHTTPAEIYRALIEATAFGARVIAERIEEYGVKTSRVVCGGGIALKNPMLMQIYADVMGKPMEIARSSQLCALGAAMAGAVVAGKDAGGHADFDEAAQAMTGLLDERYDPDPARSALYDRLFALYKRLHDCFGTRAYAENQFDLMKSLLEIRDEVRG